MEIVVIATTLVLLQYIYFGVQVGSARGRAGIKAPATTGDPEFERMFRVHQNTAEQLIVLLPALWMFAYFVNPLWGAGISVVYLVGRFVYRASYVRDPSSRSMGFTLSFVPIAVLLVWTFVVAVMRYF